MRAPRSRLKKALEAVEGGYDVILLDCPPNISTLSESVFRAADAVLIPVIPTTLSQRTFVQLVGFFKENGLPLRKLHGFFSMVQANKTLHNATMAEMREGYQKTFLHAQIPFASDVERMGVQRSPVMATSPGGPASRAYQALSAELEQRLAGV